MNIDKITIEIFNSILVESKIGGDPYIDIQNSFILEHPINLLKQDRLSDIKDIIISSKLNGEQLNSSFYKSWETVNKLTNIDILRDKLIHYLTTYGFMSFGIFSENTVWIPSQELSIPNLEGGINFRIIKSITPTELKDSVIQLLSKGIALKSETLNNLIYILDYLDVKLTPYDLESIKNKEALCIISDRTGVYSNDPIEFIRFLVYKSTGVTSLIKNGETIKSIKSNPVCIESLIIDYGIDRVSQHFLRFKPIFLAFKANKLNSKIINRLRRLSNKNHLPKKSDFLNSLTSMDKIDWIKLFGVLNDVNPFRKVRILETLNIRSKTDSRLFTIRNGKSFVKRGNKYENTQLFDFIKSELIISLSHLSGKKILMNSGVKLALPSSEKNFIGNIPTGTRFLVENDSVLFGIYWENSGGAYDLDLSSIDITGDKIGWNSNYYDEGGTIFYSGDMTYAHSGASEYLHAKSNLVGDYLVKCNIYDGVVGSDARIIIGHGVDRSDVKHNYIIDPNKVIFQSPIKLNSKENTLGLISGGEFGNEIILTNFSSGNISVSSGGEVSEMVIEFLKTSLDNKIYLNDLLIEVGCEIVYSGEFDIDLSLDNLNRDSIINLFL